MAGLSKTPSLEEIKPVGNGGFIADTPNGIAAYVYLTTITGLELEIKTQARGWDPRGCPTRGRALGSAKRILASHDRPRVRTRAQALTHMRVLAQDLNLLPKENNRESRSNSSE